MGKNRIKKDSNIVEQTHFINIKGVVGFIRVNKRIITLLLLLILSVVLNILLIVTNKITNKQTIIQENNNIKRTLLDPRLVLIEKESRIMHFSPLKKDITEYVDSQQDLSISVYFEYLVTGSNFSVYVDNNTYPASLTKVPISIMILNKIQNGKLKWEDQYTINDKFRDSLSGNLYMSADGTKFTIRQLLEENIVHSDNTAKNILYSLITPEDIALLINELGMDKLFDGSGKTTAKEYARVFRSLYYSSMLTNENSEYLLDLLTKTKRDTYMATYIPNEVTVAHKYGSSLPDRGFSDVGIVYIKDKPFLIAITIDGSKSKTLNEEMARELIANIAKKTYDYVLNAKTTDN